MVVSDFTSKTIFLNTAPLIYFIEGHSAFQPVLTQLFNLNSRGDILFITSSITSLEVLVKPLRESKPELAQQYRDILTQSPGIEILDVTIDVAEQAARLRATYNLENP